MSHKIIDLGSGFWNIRGSFKIGGLLDIGTHCSLVKLNSGKFIFLDSYTLEGNVRAKVMTLTNNGEKVESILNLHPFHTVHCAQMAKDFPNAVNYGSSRHHTRVPEVQWENDFVESEAVAKRYPELEFSICQGIHYIHPNEMIHAGSLLAYHLASKSVHVDDTLMTPPAKFLKAILPSLMIHPTTKQALKDEPNAGQQYCDWLESLAHEWCDTRNFCAAHSDVVNFKEGEFKSSLLKTVDKARSKLKKG